MTIASRTINPLHFEDLEPSRFEDLVHQLIYDFKKWRQLEASDRSGSDGGFDIRGWEKCNTVEDSMLETEDESRDSYFDDKIWLIQCKREKKITTSIMKKYLDQIIDKNKNNIFGIIFVAACNFSETTRRYFIEICRNNNIQGFHLLGKSELEDLPFLPKNDHLLFAYFGISLNMYKRSLKTQLNARLNTEQKLQTSLKPNSSVLICDPNILNVHCMINQFIL